MTDRIHSITVTLEKDMRVDDAVQLMEAITMLKGVLKADGNVTDVNNHVAQERAKHELGQKLIKAIWPEQY